jgi:hypothetical protein
MFTVYLACFISHSQFLKFSLSINTCMMMMMMINTFPVTCTFTKIKYISLLKTSISQVHKRISSKFLSLKPIQ